ncbi:hypothetical protein PG996_007628 [Apiospora saccharicola]|uniref:Uncharacterized protein n=1 Tax=Apiospora saccharicola TaxID=335842 RepID=A0ABR1VBE7_9PEZI
MCKSYIFQTQCVCQSCGRPTAGRQTRIFFPTDTCDQLPPGTSPEECPHPELPPDMTIKHRGIYPSSMCRHTVKTHLKNLTRKLLDSLVEISELVQHEARLEFEAADVARERLRLSLHNLRGHWKTTEMSRGPGLC